ncbi:MAG TPA: DUF6709 family protein [Candidatus Angelobacter sp.]|jgi:hypothetical protein|nr:DUF6709 family protein [Candidatus Angelobacter sp.]
MSSWVEGEARRANRNLLVINGLVVAGGVALAAANIKDIDFSRDFWSVLFVSLLFLLALWNCIKGIRRLSELQTTPVWKHLAVYGSVEQLSMEIEQQRLGPKNKYKTLEVTSSWLINRNLFSTWVSPVGDLAWVYKKVTKHSVNFIPTGKSYQIIIYGRHRQRIEVSMSEKKVNELLADFAARVPWAIYGYDKQLDAAWTKDAASVIATVDARYHQFKAKSSSAS